MLFRSWLQAAGYKPIGVSHSNCFMIDTGRDGHGVIKALREKKVYIGRIWPVWPNAVRISVGSPDDMAKFRTAYKKVMDAPAVTASARSTPPLPSAHSRRQPNPAHPAPADTRPNPPAPQTWLRTAFTIQASAVPRVAGVQVITQPPSGRGAALNW